MSAAVYDDDRPGMMRIHVAADRARALCERHTRDQLRELCRLRGVPAGHLTKRDLAFNLALSGVKP